MLGQTVIEYSGGTALAETHVTAYHRLAADDGDRDTVIGGRYLDRMDKREAHWRIAQHTMLYDWYQDLGRSIDWSQGLMACPGKSVGVALGTEGATVYVTGRTVTPCGCQGMTGATIWPRSTRR